MSDDIKGQALKDDMKDETRLTKTGLHAEDNHGIVNPPVYHASTVLFPTVEALENYDQKVIYGRHGTPTTFALEEAMVELEGAHGARIAPSGLAAVTVSLLSSVKAGSHVLMTDSCYAPTRNFCETLLKNLGVETSYYDPLIGADIAGLMRKNTTAVFTEAPGSLTFEMQDIAAIAQAAQKGGARVIMDNTWATPLFFKPLQHGVDLSIQAGTKYIGGHSDVMIGTIAATKQAFPDLARTFGALGLCAGPDDVYLALRGLRTMAVRLKSHGETALRLAHWLKSQSQIARVLHPGLEDDPGHALFKRDFKGACGLFGVVLKPCSKAALASMLDHMQLFKMGFSWGGFESLIVPVDAAKSRCITKERVSFEGPLLRIHAGLEAYDDLLDDLKSGLARLSKAS